MLQYELDHVILSARESGLSANVRSEGWAGTYTELILHKMVGMPLKFVQQGASVIVGEVFEASLKDTAAIRMRCQVVDVPVECFGESESLRRNTLDQPLYNLSTKPSKTAFCKSRRNTYMIAVRVLDAA